MTDVPDVDLEVLDRDTVIGYFPEARIASQLLNNTLVRHTGGIYFQNIPINPVNNLAAFPYTIAEEKGFYKIDLLPCTFPYDGIGSMRELREMLERPIDWEWFRDVDFVSTLFHLAGTVFMGHGASVTMAEVVAYYRPTSIPDLACMVAIKMPSKKYLIGETWSTIRERMWLPETNDGRQFKKSHSISYALVVGLNARRQHGEEISV